ncbi:MAG TPA: O-antigen ligase family protein [Candidatus Copromonas avistercoris]|nr:O-antigen ligase family protein [Candidatus Copromonas avistercoris]
MSKRIKKRMEGARTFEDNAALIMGIFTLAVLCLCPVVYHRYYFDILETKYQFYCALAIGAAVIMFLYGIVSGRLKAFFSDLRWKERIRGLSVTDWAMLAFWLCNVISWLLCSEWRWEAFWGTSGRYNGVFLMTIYLVIYFLMTRFFRMRRWYLDAFLAAGIFVCLFGITDYFQMDLLGFKEGMVPEQREIYTSTLGNINTYTIYVGAVLTVSALLFMQETNWKRMLWYCGNMVLASFALIMGTSDNAYLSLAALFGLSPLYLFQTKTGVRRYLISAAAFFSVIQCIDWINAAFADTVIGIDSAFNLIANLSFLPLIVLALWLLAGVVSVWTLRKKPVSESGGSAGTAQAVSDDCMGKWLVYIWIGVIALVIGAVAFVFYDANIAGHADRYDMIRSYVVFNDAWGTSRGYVWRRSIDLFMNNLTPLQQLFGYGPDTFRLLMQYYYDGKRMEGRRVIYDSAHNEYLHYLVTIGIVGLLAYVTYLGSAIVRLCRGMKDRPEVVAVTFAVIAYSVQAVVNINIPIATPIIYQLLYMGLSSIQKRDVSA